MDMRIMLEVVSPGSQHPQQSEIGSQMLKVAGDLDEHSGAGSEEQVVEEPLVGKNVCGE